MTTKTVQRIDLSDKVTLYQGDCLDITPTLEDVSAIVSDPPYGMNWNTDFTRFSGGRRNSIKKRGMGRDYKKLIIGDDQPFDPSVWLTFPKCVLWGYHHFAQHLPVGSILVWIKRYEKAYGSFLSDAELAWMKGGRGVYCKRDMSLLGETLSRIHPTQKPVSLMAWCMDKAKVPVDATILDPYMGSGSTIIAAIRTGRKAIGIEKDPEYFAAATERIRQELSQGMLSLK